MNLVLLFETKTTPMHLHAHSSPHIFRNLLDPSIMPLKTNNEDFGHIVEVWSCASPQTPENDF